MKLFSRRMSKKSNKGLMPQILPTEGETVPKLRFPEFLGMGKWDKKELEIIGEVFETFGIYSAWGLRNMTHEESPWDNHEADGGVIPATEITEYFKTRLN